MTYIKNKKILGSIVLALALVFVVGLASAPTAHAQYYPPSAYGSNYDYGGCSSCGYYGTPTYDYDNHYSPPPQQQYGPIYVSCYAEPLSVQTGQTVQWLTSLSGGNGVYYVSWTGDEGLSGTGSSISKAYYYPGYKNASVTVTSAGQTISANCSSSVNVSAVTPNYYNTYPTYYNTTPNYYNNYPTYYNTSPTFYNNNSYQSLTAYCTSNATFAPAGSPIIWSATVSGGNGYYTYSWSGTDGIAGYNQTLSYAYNNPGLKTAQVTISSNGQVITQTCNNTVTVGAYQGSYIPNGSSNSSGLDIGCYADPASATVNQPVTWNAEVTGGAAPYTYSWTGSDSLTGSQSSVIKYYNSAGQKDAIVMVTSADGKTGTRACTNSLTVHGAGGGYVAPAAPVQTAPANTQNSNGLGAAALFSLQNIPWGWVAILIILVLFGTVLYLLFNRPKI